MAWLYGFEVMSVQVFADHTKGLTTLARNDSSVTLKLIDEAGRISGNVAIAIFVLIRLAGISAELTLADADATFGDYASELRAGRLPADFADIAAAFHSGHGRDASDHDGSVFARSIGPLAALCRKHLNDHWSRVECLAQTLLAEDRIVEAGEISKILGPRTISRRKVIFELTAILDDARRS